MSDQELSPCSHCGSNDQSIRYEDRRDSEVSHVVWDVVCGCGASFEYTSRDMDRVEAIQAYNERPMLDEAVKALEYAKEALKVCANHQANNTKSSPYPVALRGFEKVEQALSDLYVEAEES